jgi:uncharacterized OB-fold protein/acyl dehydratase
MSDAKKEALEAEIRSYIGRPFGPPVTGRDAVNEAMIRQWCDAMGERHPAYLNVETAKETIHGEVVAPPTMLQAWTVPGWEMHEGYDEPKNEQQRLIRLLSENGYSGILGTNTEEEYTRYLRVGDRVTAFEVIQDVSEEKATAVGIGYFVTTKTEFKNQDGDLLGSMVFRYLCFKQAGEQATAPDSGEAAEAVTKAPSRIKPPMAHDNGWWWARVAEDDVIPIQRCQPCQKLRHPPRPMCDACGSQEFDSIDASGRATIHTFTVIHHPQVPGYTYPLIAIIVDLEEGERMASTLVDAKPEDVSIGMAVRAVIHEDEDGFKIPFFRPA